MKSLSESLLSPKVKLDAGETIKNELKNSVYGLDLAEVSVKGHVLELSTRSYMVLSFGPNELKYLASVGIQSIHSRTQLGLLVPVQDYIKDFQLSHKDSNIFINNDFFVKEMSGWNVQAGRITVNQVWDMEISGNTFRCTTWNNYSYNLIFKGIREWMWKDNECVGVRTMNLRFAHNSKMQDLSSGLILYKEDINFLLGDPKNSKDLTLLDCTSRRQIEASWFRKQPGEEWNFELNR